MLKLGGKTELERLYTVKEAATILGVDRWTVYQYIKKKYLKATRMSIGSKGQWRIKESSLSIFVDGDKKR